ncbi:alpha/beta fold hydrolase [Pseudarthrobacter sp. J1738]|uniref:alpha/beta fold hydrolase n=1 Tax=Pseudarthrobacter sp. J1738 TaxID=3420446 RepID=UPI003D2D9F4E
MNRGQNTTTAEWASALKTATGMHRFSRRAFVIGAGSASILAADMAFTRAVAEQRRRTQILTVKDSYAEAYFPDAAWILFPGFKTGWEESQVILLALRDALNQRGQLAAVGYSNLGLRVEDVVAAVLDFVQSRRLKTLYFYGHSFGGMLATQVAAILRRLYNIRVRLILLDSSPASRQDVLDGSWFDDVVFLYERGVRIPSLLRGGYELGERVANKNERSWKQVFEQSMAELSPLAPSSLLVQTESAYIYHFEVADYHGLISDTKMIYIGSPADRTVDYFSARERWRNNYRSNMVSADQQTKGAAPAHASPQWSALVYRPLITELLDKYDPLPSMERNIDPRDWPTQR